MGFLHLKISNYLLLLVSRSFSLRLSVVHMQQSMVWHWFTSTITPSCRRLFLVSLFAPEFASLALPLLIMRECMDSSSVWKTWSLPCMIVHALPTFNNKILTPKKYKRHKHRPTVFMSAFIHHCCLIFAACPCTPQSGRLGTLIIY